jgi:sugar lactone lactonase YvrE
MKKWSIVLMVISLLTACQPKSQVSEIVISDKNQSTEATVIDGTIKLTPTQTLIYENSEPETDSTIEQPSNWQFGGTKLILADGYRFEKLITPDQPVPNSLVISEDDTIFIGQNEFPPYLWVLNPWTGEFRDLALPKPWSVFHASGPGDSILVSYHEEIWQVHSDGSHEIWSINPNFNIPMEFTPRGTLLAASGHRDSLVEMNRNGEEKIISDGFTALEDVAILSDGSILLYDVLNKDVLEPYAKLYRLSPDGKLILLREDLEPYFPALTIDPFGNAYIKSQELGYALIDPKSEQLTSVTDDLEDKNCLRLFDHLGFLSNGELVAADYRGYGILAFNLDSNASRVVVSLPSIRTRAISFGPENILYLGVEGCSTLGALQSQIIRFQPDHGKEILLDNLNGDLIDLAFGPDGTLYYLLNNRLYWFDINSGVTEEIQLQTQSMVPWTISVNPISGNVFMSSFNDSSIYEFNKEGLIGEYPINFPKLPRDTYIEFDNYGNLYIFSHELENNEFGPIVQRWVLKMEYGSNIVTLLKEIDLVDERGPMGDMTVDSEGNIWIVTAPDSNLIKIDSLGEMDVVAYGVPMDTLGIAVDTKGQIALSHEEGIFRVIFEDN